MLSKTVLNPNLQVVPILTLSHTVSDILTLATVIDSHIKVPSTVSYESP